MTFCTRCGAKREGKYCGGCGAAFEAAPTAPGPEPPSPWGKAYWIDSVGSATEKRTDVRSQTSHKTNRGRPGLKWSEVLIMMGTILLVIGAGLYLKSDRVRMQTYITTYVDEASKRVLNSFDSVIRPGSRGLRDSRTFKGYGDDWIETAALSAHKAKMNLRYSGSILLMLGLIFLACNLFTI